MDEQIIYPSILIICGILLSSLAIVFLNISSRKILKLFELYPESKGILNLSLKFVSWFIGFIIFLIFLRWALKYLNLEFTLALIESLISNSPKYILAVVILLTATYISRLINEKSKDYEFDYKDRILFFGNFIIYMTFSFTALYSLGVNMTFFLEFYRVILWILASVVILVISMTIGIPLGISIYDKMKKEKMKNKH